MEAWQTEMNAYTQKTQREMLAVMKLLKYEDYQGYE